MAPPTPDFATYLRGLGVMNAEEAERLDLLSQGKWFLVRIDGLGERWRCRRCNGRHAHFTLFCLERPFRGIESGLWAYWRNIGAGDPSQLSARQRANAQQLSTLFGIPQDQPNLSTLHPRMAQALGGDDADTDYGAAGLLGVLDEISEIKATILVNLINSRARSPIIKL